MKRVWAQVGDVLWTPGRGGAGRGVSEERRAGTGTGGGPAEVTAENVARCVDQAGAQGPEVVVKAGPSCAPVPLECTWVCPKPTSPLTRPGLPQWLGTWFSWERPRGEAAPAKQVTQGRAVQSPIRGPSGVVKGKGTSDSHPSPPHRAVWSQHVSGVWSLLQETWAPGLETMPGPPTSPPSAETNLVEIRAHHSALAIPSAWEEAWRRPDHPGRLHPDQMLWIEAAAPGLSVPPSQPRRPLVSEQGQVAPPGSPAPRVLGEGGCALLSPLPYFQMQGSRRFWGPTSLGS